jgi:hypothetical protein
MRFRNADECVCDSGQTSIQFSNAVGPTCRMKCRADDGYSRYLCSDAAPEHFVTCTNSDDSVNRFFTKVLGKSERDANVELASDPVLCDRYVIRYFFTQRTSLLQADDGGFDMRATKASNQVDEQCFSPADGHASDDKNGFQRTNGMDMYRVHIAIVAGCGFEEWLGF